MPRKRVLVTGASGFIGGHVVDALDAAGHAPVPLLRESSDAAAVPEVGRGAIRRARLDDPDSLARALEGIDAAIHLAGAVRARSEAEYVRANAHVARDLVLAARRATSLERFVLVSSLAAVGPSPDGRPLDESAEPRPRTAYGRSKLLGERCVADAAGPVPFTILRPSAVYGPRDRGIFSFFRCAARGFLPKIGRGPRVYSLVHGEDVARAAVLAVERPEARGQTFFVAHPDPVDWPRLVEAFAGALGRRVRSVTLPALLPRTVGAACEIVAAVGRRPPFLTREKVHDLVTPYWTCSPDRITGLLGFRAVHDLAEGLASTARWYRERGWLG